MKMRVDQGMSQISTQVFWLLFCATACAFIIPHILPLFLLYIRIWRCYIISRQYCLYHPLLRPLLFATLRFLLLLACPHPYRMIHCTFHSCRRHRRTDAFTLPVLPSHDFAHNTFLRYCHCRSAPTEKVVATNAHILRIKIAPVKSSHRQGIDAML